MSPPTAETATAFAPAKINLSLHVTGQRADGYHLLDSLVVFAEIGDRVRVTPAETTHLTVTGPRAAGVPTGGDNLVLRAAALMDAPPLAIALDKHLPAAAGIGGGSSDAAATLRAIAEVTGRPLPDPAAAATLGADLPVCLAARPARMRGVGGRIDPVPPLPPVFLVLVNPAVSVPTPAVFAALATKTNPPMPETMPAWPHAAALAAWLADQRNDLEPPARALAPEIVAALAALSACAGCLLARISGSGATCFGLFETDIAAAAAARQIAAQHPTWWCQATRAGP